MESTTIQWEQRRAFLIELSISAVSRSRTVKEIFVYSRGAIERVPPHDTPHIVISITSAPSDTARIPSSSALRGLLRLSFADADEPSELTLFDDQHALEIVTFLRAHPEVDRLVIHCDAGLSRSPAIAAAIARADGQDDSLWFERYRPNPRVYRLLLNALTESVG